MQKKLEKITSIILTLEKNKYFGSEMKEDLLRRSFCHNLST